MNGKWDKYKVARAQTVASPEQTDKWSKYKVASDVAPTEKKEISLVDRLGVGGIGKLDTQRVEAAISERPHIAKQVIGQPPTVGSLKEHPFKTPLDILGAGMQVAESIPANIGLALQRGEPSDIWKDVLAGISGERPAELGDIYRGAGFPEPVAQVGGLLSSGAKLMPTELLGKGITKSLATTTQIPKFMSKLGKPFVAKTLSILSAVPEDDVLKAINRPEFLSGRWVGKEKIATENLYKNTIQPYIRNSQNRVNLAVPEVTDRIKEIVLRTPSDELTRQATTMKSTELAKIDKWLSKLQKGEISLNEVDATIGEIDEGLQRVYKAYEKGKLEPVTKTFEGISLQIRKALKEARNKQHPEMAKNIERYADLKTAERIYSNFDRWNPRLLNAVTATAIAGLFGFSKPIVYGAAVSSTIPKLQALGIRGTTGAGKELAKSSAIPLEALIKSRQD